MKNGEAVTGPFYKNGKEVTKEEFYEGLDGPTIDMLDRIEEKAKKWKKSIAQPVKNSWESEKPVKKVSKTPKETKKSVKKPSTSKKPPVHESKTLEEETRDTIAIGDIEYSTDNKGRISVSQKEEKPKGLYPHPGGAPTKYKVEYAEMLVNYFQGYIQEVYLDREYYDVKSRDIDNYGQPRPDSDGIKRGLVKRESHKVIGSVFPTLERFSCMIWVNRDTLRNWSEDKYDENYKIVKLRGKLKHPEFFRAYTRARELQEAILIEWAMDGRFNSQFAIFLAKNRFGYTDKTEIEQTSVGVIWVVGLPEEKRHALEYLIASKMQK